MRLIIDIPEERYANIKEEQWMPNRLLIEKAIANGTPIPDNATVCERQTAKWQDHENGHWNYAKCSECKTIHDTRSNYCPFCGARMDVDYPGATKIEA